VKFAWVLDDDRNHGGASRRWITQAVEGSLRRLRTDWIDVYEVGVPDEDTDLDETLAAERPGARRQDPLLRHLQDAPVTPGGGARPG